MNSGQEKERAAVQRADEAHAGIEASEQRYRAVVEDQAEYICRALPDGTILFVNPAYCRLYGKPADELVGRNYFLDIPEDEHEHVRQSTARLTPDEPTQTIINPTIAAGGEIRWVQWTDRAIWGSDGRVVEIQSVGRDITEQRLAEDALRESEERLRVITDAVPVLIAHLDLDRRYSFVNKTYEDWFGIPREEIVGRHMRDLLGEPAYQAASKHIDAAFSSKVVTYENPAPYTNAGGRRVQVTGVPHFDANGGQLGVYSVVTDITARVEAERALEESEARYRGLFNNSPVSIWVEDWSGVKAGIEALPARARRNLRRHFERNAGFATRLAKTISLKDVNDVGLEWFYEGSRETMYAIHNPAEVYATDPTWREAFIDIACGLMRGDPRIMHECWCTRYLDSGETKVPVYVRASTTLAPESRDTWSDVLQSIEDITDRKIAEDAVLKARDLLEVRVEERTLELTALNEQLVAEIEERRRANEALGKSEALLLKAQRLAKVDYWTQSEADVATVVNSQWLGAFMGEKGGSTYEITDEAYLERVHPEDRGWLAETYERQWRTKTSYECEYRLFGADGSMRYISDIAAPEPGGGDTIIGTLQDISEIRQAERELAEKSTLLDGFIRHAHNIMSLKDLDGRYLIVNPAYERANGVNREDVIGKTVHDVFPEAMADEFRQHQITSIETGRPLVEETVAPHADGTDHTYLTSYFPMLDERGEPIAVGTIESDITERKQAEETIRRSEENLRESQRIASIATWEWNEREMRTVWATDEYARIYGREPGWLIDTETTSYDVIHPDDREGHRRVIAETNANPHTYDEEYRIVWPDGTVKSIHQWAEPRFDDSGDLIGYRGLVQDITERKRAEEEIRKLNEELEQRVEERTAELRAAQDDLIKSERLATLGQLTATVSHELRNPLGVIRTSTYLLKKTLDAKGGKSGRALERIDRNITRCDRIINELLEFTRAPELALEPTPVDDYLREVLGEQDVPEGITVLCDFGGNGTVASIDHDSMRRAIINVYENACQAMAETIRRGEDRGDLALTVSTRATARRIEITFTDTGPGIPADALPRIFEPLFSTRGFGVGLGLTIVRRIMNQHEGDIEVKSRKDRGTRVTLWLPRDKSREHAA